MSESTARFETAGGPDSAMLQSVCGGLARIVRRVPTRLRCVVPAAAGLVMPVGWVAESAAKPAAEVCLGNGGDIMALVAAANALTLIP